MLHQTDGPQAVILGMSQDGEKICSAGGRISTQPGTALEIFDKSQDSTKNSSLIQKVTQSGHNSVVEHAFFNIAFNNVSIMVEQFLIEYRLASFTVKSRRYVDFGSMGYITPCFRNKIHTQAYHTHMKALLKTYNQLIAAGIPKEDARFVLPYSIHSNFYCSLNARELLHVLRGMLFGRGKGFEEIYALGTQLLGQAKRLAPGIFGEFESSAPKKADQIDLSMFERTCSPCTEPAVQLLSGPENASALLARTALVSQTQLSETDIQEILDDPRNRDIIVRQVLASSRPRPLEALNYTFRLNRVSLAEATHIARHRIQNVCFAPLTSVDRAQHILPPSIQADDDCLSLYEKAFASNKELYEKLRDASVAKEQLVYLVLSGNTMDVVTTMNARELLLFFQLRTCRRAQWEIQRHANEMLRLLRGAAPDIFNYFGPSCYVQGSCPEGRLTCGKFSEVQREYEAARSAQLVSF